MSSAFITGESATIGPPLHNAEHPVKSLKIDILGNEDERDVLVFLSARPIHTVYMSGLIRDNGVVSPLNRGAFYAYRNSQAKLEGVALLGPKTVIESHNDQAFQAFAHLALDNRDPQLIRGERKQIERMLELLSGKGRTPRLVCRELLLEQRSSLQGTEIVPDLRIATLTDLEQVIAINSMMAFEENGINPLERDPAGVSRRIARRIEQGREWVLVEKGRLVFKADVISESPECAFLEGIYVHPENRGRGYGFRCLAQLGRNLLARVPAICLVVNEENVRAQALYSKANYKLHSHYRTVYF